MWKILLLITLSILIFAPSDAASEIKYQMDCYPSNGRAQVRRAGGDVVSLTRSNGSCHIRVADAEGRAVFERDATGGFQVFVGAGVTTDGRPVAIIQADNFSQANASYRIFVLSLGEHPQVVATIDNQYGFWLQNDCGDKVRIWTSDGAFQGDPDLTNVYHYDLFTPEVVFEVRNGELVDATTDCREYFDENINSLRSQLSKSELRSFRESPFDDDDDQGQVKGDVLKIVFDYLYTGREQEAKEFLDRIWPPSDSARVWQSITKRRSEGVLRNITEVH